MTIGYLNRFIRIKRLTSIDHLSTLAASIETG